MKHVLALFLAFLCAVAQAAPASPQSGLWYNPGEGGRGYALDAQNETLVLAFFGYDDAGRMQWYYADGPLGCGGYCWSGTLLRFDNGQPLNGAFRPPTGAGNAGIVSIAFTSRYTGTLTLPGGRRLSIERFNHSAGAPPRALLGQWSYVYLIGSSWFVDVYVLNTLVAGTSTGNGIATNSARNAGFEYQVSGSLAGQVVGFHFTSTGTVLDQYLYELQVEEGRGVWVSPSSFNTYGMNATKMFTAAGTAKDAAQGPAADGPAREGAQRKARTIEEIAAADPVMGRIAAEMWERLAVEQAAAAR